MRKEIFVSSRMDPSLLAWAKNQKQHQQQLKPQISCYQRQGTRQLLFPCNEVLVCTVLQGLDVLNWLRHNSCLVVFFCQLLAIQQLSYLLPIHFLHNLKGSRKNKKVCHTYLVVVVIYLPTKNLCRNAIALVGKEGHFQIDIFVETCSTGRKEVCCSSSTFLSHKHSQFRLLYFWRRSSSCQVNLF